MPIYTRQDHADYCLRQLGGGVINIEISDEQIEDNLDRSLKSYTEWHFDGIERDYLRHQITATKITVADITGFAVNDTLTTTQGASATITAIDGNIITTAKNLGEEFAKNQTITNGVVSKTITIVEIGDLDNGFIEVDDYVVSVLKVLNITNVFSSSNTLWDPKYQLMMQEIRNLTSSGGTQYYYSMMNYLSHLDFVLKKEKSFRFNRRMNRIYLDVNWTGEMVVGDWVAIEVYKMLDPDSYNEIYEDLWLTRYTTALFKKQWGSNLKKYSGMQLPGGVTYDGQQIYDEAVNEIKDLEIEAKEMSAPLEFMIG